MLSIVVICQNEGNIIRKCLESLVDYSDDIVVLDGGSVDNTVDVLKEMRVKHRNIRLFQKPFNFHFGDQKNFAISMCSNKWVMVVDADEIMEDGWHEEVIQVINSGKYDAICFPRKNSIDGVFQPKQYPDLQFRLFRAYCRYLYPVHEELVGWRNVYTAKAHIIHSKSVGRYTKQQELYNMLVGKLSNFIRSDDE